MRRKIGNGAIALVFILGGALAILSSVGVITLPYLQGWWWALFIILPSIISMVTTRPTVANMIMFGIGTILFCSANDWLGRINFFWLCVGYVAVCIGVALLLRPRRSTKTSTYSHSDNLPIYSAVFSGTDARNDSKDFKGASVSAVFGGAQIDLRNAELQGDAVIQAQAVFGSIEILAPNDVNIQISGVPVFGGYEDHTHRPHVEGRATLFIECTSVFGGVEVK